MYRNLSGINQPKRVVVYDENDKYVASFASLRECCRIMKVRPTTLHRVIHKGIRLNNMLYKYQPFIL